MSLLIFSCWLNPTDLIFLKKSIYILYSLDIKLMFYFFARLISYKKSEKSHAHSSKYTLKQSHEKLNL